MNTHFRIGTSGAGMSFLGAIPPGVLNTSAFALALSSSVLDALLFSLSAVVVELLFVRISLHPRFQLQAKMQFVVTIAFVVLLLAAGIHSLTMPTTATFDTPVSGNPVVSGILLSLFNPLQLPFWIAANNLMYRQNLPINTQRGRGMYLAGIGVGSLASFLVFIAIAWFFHDGLQYVIPNMYQWVGIAYVLFALLILTQQFYTHFKKQPLNA